MARSFAAGDFIDLGASATLNPTAITISAWSYPTNFTNAYPAVVNRRTAGSILYFLGQSAGTNNLAYYVGVSSGGSGGLISVDPGTHAVSTNNWHHLSLRYDTSIGIQGFLDGVNDCGGGAGTVGGTLTQDLSRHAFIGQNPNTPATFLGRHADVGMWSEALTDAEIIALANGARPPKVRPQSLVGYWPLDGLQSPEPDLSGNANNGTLTGTALAFGPPIRSLTMPRRFFKNAPAAQNVVLLPGRCV